MKLKNVRLLSLMLLIVMVLISSTGCKPSNALKSWSADSTNKQYIIDFVKDVTNKNSENFVPLEYRVATFDMDGTIVCEEDSWIELAVAIYRIKNELPDNKELNEKADTLLEYLNMYPQPEDTGKLIEEVTGEAFTGMSQDEFVLYTTNFMNTQKSDFKDFTYKDSFYPPMLELIEYLQDNDFQVYIVSGSERGVVWGAVNSVLDLPRSHMIGGDMKLKASNQPSHEDSSYIFDLQDDLIRETGFTLQNLKIDKVYNIYHQIGIKPILAFGNSDGDFSMLNYSMSNDYKSCAFLLCHDDDIREYDYHTKEREEWNSLAEKYGWNIVSMKNEFDKVFMKDTEKIK